MTLLIEKLVCALCALARCRRLGSGRPRTGRRTRSGAGVHRLNHRSRPPARLRRPKKVGPQALGRSRGGLTTKLHFAVDALGKPLRMILSAGQVADIECAHDLIADMPCASLVADKGYDANALVMSIEASGAQAVIPPRSNRIAPRQYDRCAYRARNLIERFFNRIKHYRRIATRYDKLACSYMAFVRIVCAVISHRYM